MSFKKQINKSQPSYLIFMHINTFLFLKNFLKLGYYRARLVYNLNKLMEKKNGSRFNTQSTEQLVMQVKYLFIVIKFIYTYTVG